MKFLTLVKFGVCAQAAIGPAWTYDPSVEKPAGTRNMGTWTMSVYTPEQQARLGVDEMGAPVSKERYLADESQTGAASEDEENKQLKLDAGKAQASQLVSFLSKDVKVEECQDACVKTPQCFCNKKSLDYDEMKQMLSTNDQKWRGVVKSWRVQQQQLPVQHEQLLVSNDGNQVYHYAILNFPPKPKYLLDVLTFDKDNKIEKYEKLQSSKPTTDGEKQNIKALEKAYTDFLAGKNFLPELFDQNKFQLMCSRACVESEACWCDKEHMDHKQVQ